MIPFATIGLAILLFFVNPFVGMTCWTVTNCITGCSTLAWFITGIIWRWSSDTKYAVGVTPTGGKSLEEWKQVTKAQDSLFQVKSGNFMYYYYMIWFVFVCIGLCCCCCLCCLMCASGGNSRYMKFSYNVNAPAGWQQEQQEE